MYGGQDTEVHQNIARLLQPLLPAGARQITANAKVGDDWSEVGFEFVDGSGRPGGFSFDQHPARVAGDIGEQLIGLRRLMAATGGDPWSGCRFTLQGNGHLTADFSYDPSTSEASA